METIKNTIESEPQPIDVTAQFLKKDNFDFEDFMESLGGKSATIKIDWMGIDKARRLKAYVNMYQNLKATIRATQEQYEEGWNVFNSGVKREKV